MQRAHYAFMVVNINSMLGGKPKKIEELIGTLPDHLKRALQTNEKTSTASQPKGQIETWREGAAIRGLKINSERVKQ